MKKRILALVLALCIAASLGTVFAQAAGTFTATLDANTYAVGQNATLRWNYYPTDGIAASYYEVYLNNKVITSTKMNSILYYVDGTATSLQFYVQAYGYENGSSDPRPLGASNVVVASVTGARSGVYFVQNLSNVQPMLQQNNSIYIPLQVSVYLPSTVTNATWSLYQTNRMNQTNLVQSGLLSANTTNSIASVDCAVNATQNDLGCMYYFVINYYDSAAAYNPYQQQQYTYQQQYQYQQQQYQYQQQYSYQNMQSLRSETFTLSQYYTVINSNAANPTAGSNVTLSANLVSLFNTYNGNYSNNISGVSYQWYSGTSSVLNEATMIYGATSPTYAFTLPSTQGTYYYFCVVNALIDGANVTSTASQSFVINSGAGNMANFKQVNSGTIPFKDLSSSQWYYSYASYAYYLNLMQGSSSTTFNPNGEFKISEAIAVAARMHAIYYTGTDSNFVQGSPWYQTYVDYAIQNNIIQASDFTNYTAVCTRAQMAYILCNALPASELSALKTVSSLPDVTSNTTYATSIFTLYNAGVLTGSDKKGTFYPQNSIKRSEVSAIICRMAFKSMRSSATIG